MLSTLRMSVVECRKCTDFFFFHKIAAVCRTWSIPSCHGFNSGVVDALSMSDLEELRIINSWYLAILNVCFSYVSKSD